MHWKDHSFAYMDSLVWKDQKGNESKVLRAQSQHGCQPVSVIVSLLLLLIRVTVFGEAALRRGWSLNSEGGGQALPWWWTLDSYPGFGPGASGAPELASGRRGVWGPG